MLLPSIHAAAAALLSLTAMAQAAPPFGTTPTRSTAGTVACNNSPDLCNRNYNNITHMGAHNVAFLRDSSTSFAVAGNTFYNATVALSAGIRLLQAQVHDLNGTLQLCHSSCSLLDGGSLESWLSKVKSWMDSNPNEVISILLVNADNHAAADYGAVFKASGISNYGYTPASTSAMATWPTLQTLISANTRLVTFVTNIDYDASCPYLLPEFTYMFETPFDVRAPTGFNCTVDRPSSLSSGTGASASSAGYLSLVNHFLYDSMVFGITTPAISSIETTNSPATNTTGALGTHAPRCRDEWRTKPTFVLVDFFNVGPAVEVADALNGITPTGRIALSTAQLTADTSAGFRPRSRSGFGVAGMAMGVVALGSFVWL